MCLPLSSGRRSQVCALKGQRFSVTPWDGDAPLVSGRLGRPGQALCAHGPGAKNGFTFYMLLKNPAKRMPRDRPPVAVTLRQPRLAAAPDPPPSPARSGNGAGPGPPGPPHRPQSVPSSRVSGGKIHLSSGGETAPHGAQLGGSVAGKPGEEARDAGASGDVGLRPPSTEAALRPRGHVDRGPPGGSRQAPDRRTPFSPTTVPKPCGKLRMNAAALATSATRSTCAAVTEAGSSAPYAMFSAMEQENKVGSCGAETRLRGLQTGLGARGVPRSTGPRRTRWAPWCPARTPHEPARQTWPVPERRAARCLAPGRHPRLRAPPQGQRGAQPPPGRVSQPSIERQGLCPHPPRSGARANQRGRGSLTARCGRALEASTRPASGLRAWTTGTADNLPAAERPTPLPPPGPAPAAQAHPVHRASPMRTHAAGGGRPGQRGGCTGTFGLDVCGLLRGPGWPHGLCSSLKPFMQNGGLCPRCTRERGRGSRS